MQRYAMPAVDNLLDMERCESCGRELSAEWKYCIYCGRPISRSALSRVDAARTTVVPRAAPTRSGAEQEVIPSAFRPDVDEPQTRKYDAPFWVGVGMGILGLTLIIYAAVIIYGS